MAIFQFRKVLILFSFLLVFIVNARAQEAAYRTFIFKTDSLIADPGYVLLMLFSSMFGIKTKCSDFRSGIIHLMHYGKK